MSEDDEYGFWDSDRGRAPRHVGRRAHHSVEVEDGWSATRHSGPRTMNPLWPRLGAMVAIGVLALPVALMMRSSGDAGHLTSVESPPTSDAALIEPSSPAIVAPNSSVAPTTSVAVAATGASLAASAAVSQSPSVAPTTVAVARVETAADVESSAPSSVARAASAPPVAEKQSVLNRSCRKSYEPVAGDYWILVASKVSVDLADLLAANNATTDTPIYPGFDVCLPANASSPTTEAPQTAPSTTDAPSPTTAKPTSTTAKPTSTTGRAVASTVKPTSTTAKAPVAVAATTTTTAAPPPRSYTRDEVAQIIRDVWPDALEDEALRIATRESNLIATARNSCCYGLFQINYSANRSSLNGWGISSAAALFDPRVNAYAAYAMYLRAGGWGPWQ